LRAIVEHGHQVTACAPAASAEISATLAASGIAYCSVPVDRGGLRPDRDFRAVLHLVRLFKETRPDVVLSYMAKPVIYGSLAARLAGVPECYAMITGLGFTFSINGPASYLVRQVMVGMYRLSLRGSRRIFFQNRDDREAFERWGIVRRPEQAVMINGSGIDLEAFTPALFPADISFLLIARLLREKGIREYVEAARIVRAKHPWVRFRLVGWRDNHVTAIPEHELQGWIKEGVVEYLGRLEDVRGAIAGCSVYVLPSYYREGTPRTVLEAMAMGRPIVTTDSPGCRETVREGGNGYLVPPRNARALAQVLEQFIEQPELIPAMGRESRRIAIEKYDVHTVNAVILQAMGLKS
jgi:glycosyltransferase involved in cell wall biosynthesis